MRSFIDSVKEHTGKELTTEKIHTVQVNITLKCNQECSHCHHGAGPEREEMMTWETMEKVVQVAKGSGVETIDITGGAPEENPNLRRFIEKLGSNGHHIMVRTNITNLMKDENKKMAEFFRDNSVELIASLPCYEAAEVDCVRGDGVFGRSIEGLKYLNLLGYGKEKNLKLNLVYNPMADFLPPPQAALKADYKERLKDEFGIVFDDLFTITNMPIGRFIEDLSEHGKDDEYMRLLLDNFNPSTVDGLMCRYQISIGWDGTLYDCDFNQAIGLTVVPDHPKNIKDLSSGKIPSRPIRTADHCFGCTAGAGSSCGGALLED